MITKPTYLNALKIVKQYEKQEALKEKITKQTLLENVLSSRAFNAVKWNLSSVLDKPTNKLKMKHLKHVSLKDLEQTRNLGKKTIQDILELCKKAKCKLSTKH